MKRIVRTLKGYYQILFPLLLVVSIYNGGKEVTSGRRSVILDSGERLSALRKGIFDCEERRVVVQGKLGHFGSYLPEGG